MKTFYTEAIIGKLRLVFIMASLFLIVGVGQVWGQCTAIASGNWNTASNWSCGHIPYNHESVTIPSGFSITVTGDMNQPDVTVGGTLTVSGALTIPYGGFNLLDNAVLNVGSLSSSAPVTVGNGAQITSAGVINVSSSFTAGSNLSISSSGNFSISGAAQFGDYSIITCLGIIDFNSTNTFGVSVSMSATGNLEFDGTTTFGANSVVNCGGDLVVGGGDKLNLNANVSMTINGNASAFKGGTIAAGAELRVKGNMAHSDGAFDIYGTVVVQNDFSCTSGDGFHVYSGGKLIIKGNSTFASIGGVDIEGDLLVSGDLDYTSSGTFTLASPGLAAVGGNMTIGSTNISVEANTNMIVLGDLTVDNGGSTIAGVVVVIGEVNVGTGTGGDIVSCIGCSLANDPACNTSCQLEGDIPSTHPIWSVVEGINSIFFDGFDGESTGELVYENSGATNYDGVLWNSNLLPAYCNDHIKASAYIWLTGTGTVSFEYALTDADVNSDIGWSPISVENATTGRYGLASIPATQIKLRIKVTGLTPGSKVSIDNVLVQATNEGGIPADPVVWIDQALIATTLCPPETVTYSIDNDNGGSPRYSSVVWSFTQGGGVITPDADDPATCTVDWVTLPGELSVTVTGGSCGGETTELTSVIAIAKSPNIVLHSTVTPISCHGANNGSITVVGDCGPDNGESLVYTWESVPAGVTNPGDATSASNLPPGDYTITVTKGVGQMDTKTITLTEPDKLDVSFANANAFLCDTDPKGAFDVSITGGTEPYNYTVKQDGGDITSGLSYTNLPIGIYVVDVTDAHGCSATAMLEIIQDITDPTFTNFPANVQLTTLEYNTTYNGGNQTDQTVTIGATPNPSYSASGTFELPVNLMKYRNARVSFDVTQTGTAPTNSDILQVEVSYDGTTWEAALLTDPNTLAATSISLNLGDGATLNKDVVVRLTFTIVTSGVIYNVSNFKIIADEQVHDFLVVAPGCEDNSGVCTVEPYVDSDPIWSNCKDYDDGEFRIERTWTVKDDCGHSISKIQYLSVGNAPIFNAGTFPVDASFDFCHNEPTITAPTPFDVCGNATVSWVAKNSSDEVIGSGDNTDLSGVTFPADAAGDNDLEYTVTWTATDDSHLTYSQVQTITIKPVIVATYLYNVIPDVNDKLNVCLEQSVNITIAPKGGTGVYTYSDFSPVVTGTAPVVTTTGLTTTTSALSFKITDVTDNGVTGGCTVDLNSASFDVHDLIPTGVITRE